MAEMPPVETPTPAEPFTPIDLDKAPVPPREPAPETTKPDLPEQGEAAPPEEVSSGEGAEADPAPPEPSIEPPRSWSKEDKELFTSLPRETQERVAERERLRERDFLQRQNEAAEKLKGLTAKEQAVERARQQYEAALPQLFQQYQQQMAGEFADIRSWQDVEKMRAETPDRYLKFDLAQKQANALAVQMQQVQVRQAEEQKQRWQDFTKAEDAKFLERAPEAKDPVRWKEIQATAEEALRDVGFTDDEVNRAYREGALFSMRDHRTQLLLRDAAELRLIKAKAKAAKPTPQPPPLAPGTASSNRGQTADVRNAAERGDMASFIKLREKGRVR